MSKAHQQVVEGFKDGKEWRGHSIFAEEGTLYSHGRHLPLAVNMEGERNLMEGRVGEPWVLLNGDSYSSAFNQHQRLTFKVFNDQPRIAFSCLRAANLSMLGVCLVDFTKDEYKSVTEDDPEFEGFEGRVPPGATYYTHTYTQTTEYKDGKRVRLDTPIKSVTKGYHRIGCVVLGYFDGCYLFAMDAREYFVSMLPHAVRSVDEAFLCLKPQAVKEWEEREGKQALRQGEWFFLPRPNVNIGRDMWEKAYALPHAPDSNIHYATRGCKIVGMGDGPRYFVQGAIRHSAYRRRGWGREEGHRMARLGMEHLWEAVESTAIQSWTAGGRVD